MSVRGDLYRADTRQSYASDVVKTREAWQKQDDGAILGSIFN